MIRPIDNVQAVRTDIVKQPEKTPQKGDSLSGHRQPPIRKRRKRDSADISEEAQAALAETKNAQRNQR